MELYIWYPADPVIGYWVEEVKAYWNARPVLGDTLRPVLDIFTWPQQGAVTLSGGYGDVNGAPINCMEDFQWVNVPAMLMWGTYDFRVSDMLETYDTPDAPKYGIEIFYINGRSVFSLFPHSVGENVPASSGIKGGRK